MIKNPMMRTDTTLLGMLASVVVSASVAVAQVHPGKALLDKYAALRADAGEILRNKPSAGICPMRGCCTDWALFLRDEIFPWYKRRSDLQQSISAVGKLTPETPSSISGMLSTLDTAQNELYMAVSTMAMDCNHSAAQCHLRDADKFAHAAVLFNAGRIEAAQKASDLAHDYMDLCSFSPENKCSCM
jgi:hypothetical protein